MDQQTMLAALKTNLTIAQSVTAYDTRLSQLLTQAEGEIRRMGASTLSPSTDVLDAELCIEYAQYLWKRRDNDTGLPVGLRLRIHNRVFGQHMGGDES